MTDKNKAIAFTTKAAGLFTVCFRWKSICLHFLPKKEYRKYWWYSESWYDGPLHQFGIGPLLLVSWDNYWKERLKYK